MIRETVDVTTAAGVVRGLRREGSVAFLGIPFAEPPVGDLRFAAPVPHRPWEGVRDAVEYGPTPQRQALAEITLIPEPSIPGESILNLNVFTPRPGEPDAELPVLVYIHGGGFIAGSIASPWYDGAAFNRDGVVTVNISYRLGVDGFGWIEDAPHNRGILDWLLALEWVRDNITAFGGDPAAVTIAGQSAGGGAVLTLLAVPRAADLFQRAISLSAPRCDVDLETAEKVGRAVAALGGVAPTRAGFSNLDERQILELQEEVSAVELPESVSEELAEMAGLVAGLPWAPVVDGALLPEPIVSALSRGVGADKVLLLGATDNEFNFALGRLAAELATTDAVVSFQAFGLPEPLAAEYIAAHPQLDNAGLLGQFITDSVFRGYNRAIAEVRTAAGAPAWLYRFAWPSPTMSSSVHCLDVPFFFDCLTLERVDVIAGDKPPAALAREVHGAAVRVIRDGPPGWPAYELPARQVRVYDETSSTVTNGYGDADLASVAWRA